MAGDDELRRPAAQAGTSPMAPQAQGPSSYPRRAWPFVSRHKILAGLVILALIGAGFYTYEGEESAQAQPLIVAAERSDVENVVTAVGNLQPLNFVDVGAQVSGQLKTLHVM